MSLTLANSLSKSLFKRQELMEFYPGRTRGLQMELAVWSQERTGMGVVGRASRVEGTEFLKIVPSSSYKRPVIILQGSRWSRRGKQVRALSQAEVQTSPHRKDSDRSADAGGPLRSLAGKVQEVSAHFLESQETASRVSSNAYRNCFE